MTEQQQQALALRLRGHTFAETAAIMGITPAEAASLVHQAIDAEKGDAA